MLWLDAILSGAIVAMILVAAGWLARRWTIWQESRIPLIANCLLTRRPIILISLPSPLWKFWGHDQKALQSLQNHGYDARLWQTRDFRRMSSPELDHKKFHWLASHEVTDSHLPTALHGIPRSDLRMPISLIGQAVRFAEQDFI